jgi:hypothetical protein
MKYGNAISGTLAVLLLLLLTLSSPAPAVELTIQTANDPVSGSDRPDDLYTAVLAVDMSFAHHSWTLGERMFTDREREVRFDETFLEMSRDLPEWAGWQPRVGAGVLHVGRGLLGERVQNEIHRWVGSDLVHLGYIQDSQWYATGRVSLDRGLLFGRHGTLGLRLEAAAAPGFQSSVRAELLGDLRLPGELVLRLGLGARTAKVESDLLADRIDELGPTWEVGLGWRAWTLRYAFNDHGTESDHLSLAVRVGSLRNRGEQAH